MWRGTYSKCQIADRARGIVEPDTIATDLSTRGGLINLKGGIQHVFAIHVKEQIPEIMVPVRPGSAVVIENTVDRIGCQIERQIVQSDITVNQSTILHADPYSIVTLDDLLHDTDQSVVIHHLGKSLAHPMTRLWPSDTLRKPASHVYFGNFCVLLGEDCADGTADPLRQPRIRLAAMKETPRIASARNHLAN